MMPRTRSERGFALVAVLWTVMIVALIATSIMMMRRADTTIVHIRRVTAENAAFADAGITIAILRLLSADAAGRPPLDATPIDLSFEGLAITVRIQDESGKLDLNAAPGPLLERLLVSVGLDPDTAQTETDRILDWREPGDLRRLNGAKPEDYSNAGLPYGPRLGPFPGTAELRLVLGITSELFANLSTAITIYSQQAGVDARVAPRQMLLALPGMDAEAVDRALLARRAADEQDTAQPYGLVPQDLSGHAFTIAATLARAGRTVTRTAIIRLSGDMQNPIWVYCWQ